MNPNQLKEMNEINWWHKINLKGVVTPGKDNSEWKLSILQLPKDLKGKSVIDVGAWDGFFSFEAEKRNAKSVLAIDSITWQNDKLWDVSMNKEVEHSGKKGFNFAHKILGSNVESYEAEVMNLNSQVDGKFDLVLCLGILYHMEDPYGMCKVMYDITADDGICILETHMDCMNDEKPKMAFYPNKECNNDPGTWCGPNKACVIGMLESVGFEVKCVFEDSRINRGVFHAFKN